MKRESISQEYFEYPMDACLQLVFISDSQQKACDHGKYALWARIQLYHPTNVWRHHTSSQCTVNSLDKEGDVKSIHPLLPYPIKAHQSSVMIAVPDGSGVAKGVGWCRPGKLHPLSCLPGQSSDGGLQGGWGQAGETPLTSDLLDRRIREI